MSTRGNLKIQNQKAAWLNEESVVLWLNKAQSLKLETPVPLLPPTSGSRPIQRKTGRVQVTPHHTGIDGHPVA